MIAGIPTGIVRFALTSGGRSGSTLLQDQITLMKLTNQDYKGGVQFVMTSGGRAGSTLLQDTKGYLFSFNAAYKSGFQRWDCSKRCRLKCRAYVKALTSEIDEGSGEALLVNQHCHPPYKSE